MEYTVNRKGEKFYVGDVVVFSNTSIQIERTITSIDERGEWTDELGSSGWLPNNLSLVRRPAQEDGEAWTTP